MDTIEYVTFRYDTVEVENQPRTQGTFSNESTLVDRGQVVSLYCQDFGNKAKPRDHDPPGYFRCQKYPGYEVGGKLALADINWNMAKRVRYLIPFGNNCRTNVDLFNNQALNGT